MKAMLLNRTGSLNEFPNPLILAEIPEPLPNADEILIRVSACGVCHTELDEIEGRVPPKLLPIVPGHEVIGYVVKIGKSVTRFTVGDRIGVGWIFASTGEQDENLAAEFRATGRDVNGGYAESMVVPENYGYSIPETWSDVEAAPLLCAGAIGYRALRLTGIRDGDALGLTGFGGSAHLVLQLSKSLFPNSEVFVFARDVRQREFAMQLGAVWTGATEDLSPKPLKAIIDTTPAWKPVVAALGNLAPGGRLVINAIRKEDSDKSELLKISYHEHLWMEREIKSIANITQFDIREFLKVASEIPIRPEVEVYPLAQANEALRKLKSGGFTGAKVLLIS